MRRPRGSRKPRGTGVRRIPYGEWKVTQKGRTRKPDERGTRIAFMVLRKGTQTPVPYPPTHLRFSLEPAVGTPIVGLEAEIDVGSPLDVTPDLNFQMFGRRITEADVKDLNRPESST